MACILCRGIGLRAACVFMVSASTVAITAAAATAQDSDVVKLDKVRVVESSLTDAQSLQKEATAEDGYRAKTVSQIGPFGPSDILDAPYSVQVQSQDLIENLQAGTPDAVLKTDPFVQPYMPTSLNGRPTFNLRGFYVATVAEDGMQNYNGWVNAMEDVERVETLTGLSGFLYGVGNVGGLINYVSKRPTDTSIYNVKAGSYGGGSWYVHGDFGGPIGDGTFGYRLNLMRQGGDPAVDHQTLDRSLVTAAFDWHVAKGALLQVLLSHQENDTEGLPASWGLASGAAFADVPDAGTLWTQKWSFNKVVANKAQANLSYKILDNVTLRAGYTMATYRQHQLSIGATLQTNGTYKETMQERAPRTLPTNREYLLIDVSASTFGVRHKITAGFYGNRAYWSQHQDASYSATLSGTFTLSEPNYVAKPNYSIGNKAKYTSNASSGNNVVIGDEIVITDQFKALVGVNYANVITRGYSTAGKQTSKYDKSAFTPSVSLIYRPLSWLSAYATYVKGLEQGGTAAATYGGLQVTNAGDIMAPISDCQYEVGAKALLGKTLFTLAWFDIDKASDVYTLHDTSYTYSEDGREEHKGVEVGVSGKAFDGLTLFGGFTWMKAEITKNPQNPSLVGNMPANVSDKFLKLYAEYSIPGISGLTVTGGLYYDGPFYANSANTVKYASATTGDLGLRYELDNLEKPLIFRLDVKNVADHNYWLSSGFVGDPRIVSFSVESKL